MAQTIPTQSRTILITGCSSGFGLLTAARLASKGHTVIATMRNLDKQGPLLEECQRRNTTVHIMPCDVTDRLSVHNCFKEVGARYGSMDVLVNNAGYGIAGFFEDLTDEEIRAQMDTNFFGVLNVTREAIPFMRPQKHGKIINISSVSGFSTGPCFSAYCASKWALEGFSESLRYELKPFGVDVFLIEPGTYKTKIFYENGRYAKQFHDPASPYCEMSAYMEKKVKAFVNDSYKDPEDIAILVEKLIHSKSPSFRNRPDIETQALFLLRKFLPFRLYAFLINKAIPLANLPGRK
ncbi:MAG TPA: SDR family NAD(P)-dependent oxidoreductase [Candidatus Omnitrophota bacterium]|nr:SDR family NAD(P)-dependent oxidoreductase [Candidatus Omnitrophota bacterium]HPN55264.1 SDR family NAD(P)-dependent oxidoreductase [Candidatus Omnitrophota bacterium]